MATTPEEWTRTTEQTEYDELMDREFETRVYTHEDDDAAVRLVPVEDHDGIEGWGYLVTAEGDAVDSHEIGVEPDMETAVERAVSFMRQY